MGDSYTRQALSDLAVEERSFDLDELLELGPGGSPRCLDHTLAWIKTQLGAPLNARP